jgi:hypothetical protein
MDRPFCSLAAGGSVDNAEEEAEVLGLLEAEDSRHGAEQWSVFGVVRDDNGEAANSG